MEANRLDAILTSEACVSFLITQGLKSFIELFFQSTACTHAQRSPAGLPPRTGDSLYIYRHLWYSELCKILVLLSLCPPIPPHGIVG